MIFQRFAVAFGLANQRNLSYERGIQKSGVMRMPPKFRTVM